MIKKSNLYAASAVMIFGSPFVTTIFSILRIKFDIEIAYMVFLLGASLLCALMSIDDWRSGQILTGVWGEFEDRPGPTRIIKRSDNPKVFYYFYSLTVLIFIGSTFFLIRTAYHYFL